MVRRSALWLRLGIALSLALVIGGCSSSDGDQDTASGGAPSAAAEGYKIKQSFDMSIEVTSPVFSRIRRIPRLYSCPGQTPKAGLTYETDAVRLSVHANISPPLEWTGVPEGTASIALYMDSDQLPGESGERLHARQRDENERWAHWVIWNIPADATGLPEAVATTTEVLAIGPGTGQGINDDETVGYSGPCPGPANTDYLSSTRLKLVFDYIFHVYALDTELDLGPETTKAALLAAIDGHILAGGEIKGQFVAKKILNHPLP